MSKFNSIFGSGSFDGTLGGGMEMFEDAPGIDTSLAAADAAVAQEQLEEAQERLVIALEDRAIVETERAIVEAVSVVDSIRSRIDTVEVMQGSMESLLEAGVSRKAAGMLMDNYHRCLANLGKESTAMSSGTESLDDEAEFIRMMNAGLEELDGEKKGLFARLGASIKSTFESVGNAITKLADKAVRVKSNAADLKKAAAGKPSTEVSVKNKQLLVKGGGASTDLQKDFDSFTKLIDVTLTTLMDNGTKFISGDTATALNSINSAKTIKDCIAGLNKITIPKVPGVTIKQKDDKESTISRSEVELGGWAIFLREGKVANAGSTVESALDYVKSTDKLSLSLAQAPFDGGGDKEFTANLDGAAAVALATAVEKLADTIIAARKTHFKAFSDAYNTAWDRWMSGNDKIKGSGNEGEVEDGVAKIQAVALQIPYNVLEAFIGIPNYSCKAALSVGEAVLDVVAKVAKAKLAAGTEDLTDAQKKAQKEKDDKDEADKKAKEEADKKAKKD